MEFLLLVVVVVLPAYVLGSANGAIITSKLLYRKDIRDYGSRNAGLTNFYRVFGKGGALLVVFIDVMKAVFPVIFGGWLFAYYLHMTQTTMFPFGRFLSSSFFGQALAGFAVMLGHCFPLFYKFKGGKGVLSIGCIVFVIDWRLALISWGVFIAVVILTRYISLGSILGSIAFPVSMLLFGFRGMDVGGMPELGIISLCVLLVIVRHMGNIVRIIKGEESRFSFRRKKAEEE